MMDMTQAVQYAISFYRQYFESSLYAQKYVTDRGITLETARNFVVGYAPTGNRLAEHIETKGNNELKNYLLDLDILRQGDDGRVYDFFRDRIMIPISDFACPDNPFVGFGGRAVSASESVKYLNSAESLLFNKGKLLFGFKRKTDVDCAYCMEGYFDVISAHQHGFISAFAALGTAINAEQLANVLDQYQGLTFVFDGDKAGVAAAARASSLALAVVDFPTRVKVCVLPDNHDPDSYLKAFGPNAFRQQLAASVDCSDFLISNYKTNTLDEQVKLIADMRDVIASSNHNLSVEIAVINGLMKHNKQFSVEALSKMMGCSLSATNECKKNHQNRYLSL